MLLLSAMEAFLSSKALLFSQLHHISKHNVTKAAVYDTLVTLLFQFYYFQYIFYKSHIFINTFMLEPSRNSYAWISNPLDYPGFMEKDENQQEQRRGSWVPINLLFFQ